MIRSLLQLVGSTIAFAGAHLLRLTGRRVGVAIVYHRIGDPPGDPARELVPKLGTRLFRSQVRHLRSCYRLVSASELPQAVAGRRRGQRIPAAITFDDDLASHARVAAPILQEMGVTATFFLTGATLSGPSAFWWERLQAAIDRGLADERLLGEMSGESSVIEPAHRVPSEIHQLAQSIQLMEPSRRGAIERKLSELVDEPDESAGLRAADVARLARSGFEIGFHTLHHHYLPALSDGDLARAMREGRAELAEAAGAEPEAIAYPHGGGGGREAAAARAAGFRVGYTTTPEPVRPTDDPLLLGRVEGSRSSTARLAVRVAAKIAGVGNWPQTSDSGIASGRTGT